MESLFGFNAKIVYGEEYDAGASGFFCGGEEFKDDLISDVEDFNPVKMNHQFCN